MSPVTAPSYAHLEKMSDSWGLFEHAEFDQPRWDEGYCLDDVSRGLMVAGRHASENAYLSELAQIYLAFIDEAIGEDGKAHNRRNIDGEWTDLPGLGDWWGRAVWGLGSFISMTHHPEWTQLATSVAIRAMQQRSPFLRTNMFATLGAADILLHDKKNRVVRNFLEHSLSHIPLTAYKGWNWPEARMAYGNGSLAEAVMVAGKALDDQSLIDRGLQLLSFLLATEYVDDHLSVTGVMGRNSQTPKPQFDQQPIEVCAIAEASVRAYVITGNASWLSGLDHAWKWFNGHNDSQTVMYDLETGAGFDGLEQFGRNENRGAESTLAALTTHQHFARYESVIESLS